MNSTAQLPSARWQTHIDAHAKSGQPQKVFCASRGISYASFGYWKRRLSQGRSGAPVNSMFIPLVPTAVGRDVMRVALPSGIVMDVPIGSDPKWLSQILSGQQTK